MRKPLIKRKLFRCNKIILFNTRVQRINYSRSV